MTAIDVKFRLDHALAELQRRHDQAIATLNQEHDELAERLKLAHEAQNIDVAAGIERAAAFLVFDFGVGTQLQEIGLTAYGSHLGQPARLGEPLGNGSYRAVVMILAKLPTERR